MRRPQNLLVSGWRFRVAHQVVHNERELRRVSEGREGGGALQQQPVGQQVSGK